MEITKNLRIEAVKEAQMFEQHRIVVDTEYYALKLGLSAVVNEVLKLDDVLTVWLCKPESFKLSLELTDYDQSTIDDVLLDIDFVLNEMLNEKQEL